MFCLKGFQIACDLLAELKDGDTNNAFEVMNTVGTGVSLEGATNGRVIEKFSKSVWLAFSQVKKSWPMQLHRLR